MNVRTSPVIFAGLTALALTAAPAQAQAPAYTIGDLGSLANAFYAPGLSSGATAINDRGQITGFYQVSDGTHSPSVTHAFLYSGIPGAGGKMTDLGATIGGSYPSSFGHGINHAGQIVGDPTTSFYNGFFYSGDPSPGGDGRFTDIGSLGSAGSAGLAINNAGQFTGYASTPGGGGFGGPSHAYLGSLDAVGRSVLTDIGPAGTNSQGTALNDAGQVVGSFTASDGQSHAFLYTSGAFTDLGSFGVLSSQATGINATGRIIGSTQVVVRTGSGIFDYQVFTQGFVATVGPGGAVTMSRLGTLGVDELSDTPAGINSAGQVVGSATFAGTGAANARAFLFSGGHLADLNTLIAPDSGWTLTSAAAINDAGQIVGTGIHKVNGVSYSHAFVLNPTGAPEPSTIAGLGSGVLALGALTLRARKTQKGTRL